MPGSLALVKIRKGRYECAPRSRMPRRGWNASDVDSKRTTSRWLVLAGRAQEKERAFGGAATKALSEVGMRNSRPPRQAKTKLQIRQALSVKLPKRLSRVPVLPTF